VSTSENQRRDVFAEHTLHMGQASKSKNDRTYSRRCRRHLWGVPDTESARFRAGGLFLIRLISQVTGWWVCLQAVMYSAGVSQGPNGGAGGCARP
jgi:hypothetical protein